MSIKARTIYPTINLSRLLITLENGSRPSGGVGRVRIGVPSLGGEHISNDGKFNFENIKYVPQEYFKKMSRGVINKHDVLIVKDGATTGKVAFVGDDFPFENAVVNEHVFIMRSDRELLLPEYLFFFLYSAWGQAQIEREFHGGAIGGINQSFADHLEIVVPPMLEQQYIIRILRQATTLYEWRQDTNKKLDTLIKALFNASYTAFSKFKMRRLSEVCEYITKGTTPNTSDITDIKKDDTDIPFLKVNHISDDGSIKFEDSPTYVRQSLHTGLLNRSKVFPNDVLMNIVGPPLGKIGIVPNTYGEWNTNQAIAIFRCKDEILPLYLFYTLRSQFILPNILRLAVGIRQLNISLAQCREIEIPVPDINVQQKFVDEMSEIRKINEFQQVSLLRFQELQKSLYASAFSSDMTASWREKHKDELQRSAVERDKALGLRGEKPRRIDFEEGRVTPEELEGIRNALGNFAANLASYHIDVDGLARSLEEVAKPLTQSLVSISQNLITPFLESFRQSLQNRQLAQPVPPDEEEINRQIDLLPLPQEKRAIHDVLDATSLRVLKLAHASPAYFTPEDLTFGGITSTHTSASLRVLDSLGFVRMVEIDGVLRYHVIDANTDTALKPDQLQQ